MFDLYAYLDDRGIDYRSEGKNIGRDDIAIRCFACDDPSAHLAIHRDKGIWHCWSCGEKGNLWDLIRLVEENINLSRKIDFKALFKGFEADIGISIGEGKKTDPWADYGPITEGLISVREANERSGERSYSYLQ